MPVEVFGFSLAIANGVADPFDFAVVALASPVARCYCGDYLPMRVAFLVRGVGPIAKGDGTLEICAAAIFSMNYGDAAQMARHFLVLT